MKINATKLLLLIFFNGSKEVDTTRKIIVKNLTDEKSRGPSSARVLVCTIEKVVYS